MRAGAGTGPIHEVVLVGGGHTHVQVLKSWAMDPPPGARLTLVVDRPVAIYSGMVPGLVAGQYARAELEIDVWPLARRAGARCIAAPAIGVDAAERRIAIEDRAPLRYDTASFDVGSTVGGVDLPGVRAHAVPTRPIADLVDRADEMIARLKAQPSPRVIVVGAGAGGIELAFGISARLAATGAAGPHVTILERGPAVLPGYPRSAVRRVEDAARARGFAIRCGASVAAAGPDHVLLDTGERLPCDALVWVAGAASVPLFTASGLPTDARGFVRVRPTLQIVGHDELFAVGDCASLEGHPDLPKAGVYAVREGPVLVHNLRARLAGRRLRRYRPQRDYLSLLNLGDGRAIASKWGIGAEGRSMFRLKDWIDRRFMRRFQVLGPDDGATPEFRAPAMGGAEMLCGGCAAKVGESVLSRALERIGAPVDPAVIVGLAERDDVAAVASESGEVVVSTVDSFRAFTDDPYLVGRVAAVNAMSDLWAKGIAPRFALAQVTVPDGPAAETEESLYQVMAGARAALDPARVTLVGGHTTSGPELAVGFSVFAFAPPADGLLRVGGLQPGERLILTKPLGTGVLFRADMQGLARGAWVEAAIASMTRANADASRAALAACASAATDVTGFGLAGHLGQMLRASKASAVIDVAELPLLPGVASLFARGLRSTFHEENARARRGLRIADGASAHPAFEALFDPQTSGGLLFGVSPARADDTVARLRAAGDTAARVIGIVTAPRPDNALFEVVAGPPSPPGGEGKGEGVVERVTRGKAPIETDRLRLDPLTSDDLDAFLDMLRDEGVRRYLLDGVVVEREWARAEIEASARRFADGSLGIFLARERAGDRAIGFTGFRPFREPPVLELLYALYPEFWGRGLATEMGRAMIRLAFDRGGLDALHTAIDAPNAASRRVIARLGFSQVGVSPGAFGETLHFRLARADRPRG